jgi:hypothetical protein
MTDRVRVGADPGLVHRPAARRRRLRFR